MTDNENRTWLYKRLKNAGYNLGEYEDFSNALSDDNNKRWLYDKAQAARLNVGTFDDFSNAMGGTLNPAVASTPIPTPEPVKVQSPASAPDPMVTDSSERRQYADDMIKAITPDFSKPYVPTEKQVMQEQTKRQLDSLESRLSEAYETRMNKLLSDRKKAADEEPWYTKLAKAGAGAGAHWSNVGGNDEMQQAKLGNDEIYSIEAAQKALRDARAVINEADKSVNEGNIGGFIKGAGRGLKEKLFDPSTWDMGISDLQQAGQVYNAIKAYDNGEQLTESQQMLLDAMSVKLATDAYFASDLGYGYKAGKVTAESLPFMLEMMINPAAATGKTAQAALTRYAIKRFGKNALKNNAGKYIASKALARGLGDVAGAAAMTATTGIARTAADAIDRTSGDLKYETDENGNIVFGGHENGASTGEAIGKAFIANTIENHSEMLGNYFSPIIGAVGKGVGKGLDKIGLSKVNNFIKDASASDIAKVVSDFESKTQWNGTIGEYAEEVAGGIENAILVGDQTLDTDEQTGVFNLEKNIETFLGVALMGGVLSGIKTVGYRTPKHQALQGMKTASKNAASAMGNNEAWEVLQSDIDTSDSEKLKELLADVAGTDAYTQEQKKAIFDYAKARMAYNGVMNTDGKRKAEADPATIEAEAAYDNGQSLETPKEMHDAELAKEARAEDVRSVFGLSDGEDVDAFLQNNPGIAQNEQEQQVIDAYNTASAMEQGMIDKQSEVLDDYISNAETEINSRVNHDDGMIHPVTIKGSKDAHHVVSGTIVTFDDGSIDLNTSSSEIIVMNDVTGEKKMMTPGMIESIGSVVDPAEQIEVAKQEIINTTGKQMADAIDGVLPFNPGDKYTIQGPSGDVATAEIGVNELGVADNGDGTVNVSFDGGNTFVAMGKQDVQSMADAYNKAVVESHKMQGQTGQPQQMEQTEEQVQEEEQTQASDTEAQPAVEPMPMIGEGEDAEPDFMNATPERSHQYIYEEAGLNREEATEFVKANIAEAEKNLTKAKKNPPKIGTNISKYKSEKAQYESLVGQMQAVVDYWNAVKAQQDAIVATETQQAIAEQEARQVEATEKAIIEEQERIAEVARKQEEQDRLGANNVSPIISEKWNAAQKIEGAPNELTLANGEKIQGKYYLVESGVASASHDANNGFVKTEGFPLDENGHSVNDRDYENDTDAQKITRRIASEYDNRAVQTPVIVSRDGVVLSGNGRTMAGELAAANNTDGAYIEYLTNYPQQFGFTSEQVSSMRHPRVVFVPDVDMLYNTETFAKFNQQEMKGQSKTETAVKLGKVVDDDTFKKIIRTINRFDRLADFYADSNAAREAIKLLNGAGVLSDVQMAEMFDADMISAHGKELLENMLIGKAFESNPNAVRQITTYKSVRQSIISALAEISNNIALGEEYSLEQELSEAIDLVYKARQNGIKEGEAASSFARQGNLFQFDDGATAADYNNATVMMLADVLNDSRSTYLRKILTLYNDNAADGAAGQQDLFTGSVETKDQILTSVQNIINHGTEAEQQAAIDNAVEQRKAEAESIQENEPVSTGDAGQQPDVAPFTAPSPKDGENMLEYAERVVEVEKRREEEAKTDTNPTEAQKEAGNYKKGHIKLDGYDITIENPKGSERAGVDENGHPWSVTMNNTYGYIRRTEGVDGDHIDVFLSDTPDSGSVFVIDQVKPDGSFDEHKVMYGFNTAEEAREAYLSNYSEGWQGLGTITEVSKEEFKKWIESSRRKTKPFAEYKSVKAEGGQNEQKPAATGYTIEKRYHKKNNADIYAVKFTEKMDRDGFLSLKAKAKDFGGYYSSFGKGGFIFDTEADAKKFADYVTGNKEVGVPVSKVDAMGLMEQLSETGEAKLSDFAQPIDTKTEMKEQPTKNEGAFGLVSDERMEELKARLRKKLGGQVNVGIDPEILAIGIELAAGHIDRGVKSFSDFSKKMVADIGDVIRPYLKAFYNGARDMPEVVEAGINKGMTPYDEVSKFDVANFDKQAPDVMATADIITKEQNVQKQVKEIEDHEKQTEDLHHGYKVGDKVWFTRKDGKNKREIATIYQFDEGFNVTLDTGLAPIMYEAATFSQIEPYKEQETKEKQPQNKKDNGLQRNDDNVRTQRVSADDSRSGEGLSRSVEKDGERTAEGSERSDGGREREGSELDRDLRHGLHTVSGEKNSRNNRSERGVDHAPSSVDSRIKANIDAIKLSKQLIENDETATGQQMEVLRKFSGWGGLGKAFSDPTYSNQLKQLLGAEAYQEAIKSANSGYYTPAVVIDTLWDIADKLGFKGGNILEGSAGIGNILGQMPEKVSKNSDIQAVEYDSTTGGILSLLYPDAEVNIQGFEQTRIPNGSVDLAITNVPFVTGLRVRDTSGDQDLAKKFHNIHDFCIAKNVRKLREGGLGIFITSNGTLDNSKPLRDWVTNEGKSDFIGAFRMHNKTFIGAPVTSDIIVVRKRVNGVKSPYAIDLSDVSGERVAEYDTGDTRKVKGINEPVVKRISMDYNKYFMEHPENMAGEMKFGFEEGDTYRPASKGLYPVANKNQDQMLADFVSSFKRVDDENIYETPGNKEDSKFVLDASSDGKKLGEMYIKDGQLVTASLGGYYPLNLSNNKIKGHTKEECFESYSKIKDALNKVLYYQTENEGNEGLRPLLDNLNKAYDSFVNTYGHFNGNRSISFLRNDVDYPNVSSLEIYKKVEDKPGHVVDQFEKTDVFKKRVVEKEVEPNPKNIKDGIVASIFKYSRINIPYIAGHLGKSEKEVKEQIINSGLGFEDPVDRQVEVSFKYLSGNVREKLRQAQENNVDGVYNANIKALQDVLPISIPAHLIDFTLGSSWLSPKLYDEYVKDRTGIDVKFKAVGGTWFMAAPDYGLSKEKNKSFGVISKEFNSTIYGHTLIEAAIQNKSITVSKTRKKWDGTTETIIDKDATQACANKIDEIRQDFKEWARQKMQASPEMSAEMERVYNDTFNNYVPMSIPSEFVPEYFAGATHQIKMKEHQGKAIVRGTMQPLLLAHEVGTGKTFTLISTAMEMRRLGTARKPMVVVQNATVGQFVSSAKTLYPNARILTLEDTDRSAEGRRNFYAKIKYNDWDMIVVPQSTFEFIPDSEERQMAFIQDKIEEKMRVLDQMKEYDPNGNSIISRQAEREIDQLKDELANLAEETSKKHDEGSVASQKKREVSRQNALVSAQEMLDRRTDDVENFDDMGIDALLVDEAHEYKHLGFATAMQRGVKGVDPSYSKKSQGVYLKTQAVLEKNNGRNVVFATGTPISNTAAEIWTFMRYLMPADTMREYGIYYFDDFVRNFGNIQQMLEFTTSGKFKENNRFAGYVNLPELIRIWSSVSDTVLTKDAAGVNDKIPDIEGGRDQDIYLPQTKALRSIMKYVKSELERFDDMSGKEKKQNSHIPLTMYGIAKAAAVDARLVQSDAEDDPQSKTNEAVRQTLRSLKETDDYKGTVAIFADNYKNNQSGFNLYEDIKNKLVDNGVPADKIVVMKPGMTIKKKLEIFDKLNSGDIRVILGSTFTAGTGVNIHERLHTLIHLDAPNRPMDYTQRNGRILRQGNLHKQWGKPVRILRFGVEDSLDVTAYQRLKTKGAIAESIMSGKNMMANSMNNRVLEEEEDIFGDTVAQLSGSEYAMLKNNAEKNMRKYESRKKQWEADQIYIHSAKPKFKGLIAKSEEIISENQEHFKLVKSIFKDGKFNEITIGKNRFANTEDMADFIKDYNKSIINEVNKLKENAGYDNQVRDMVIDVDGLKFKVSTKIYKDVESKNGSLFTETHRIMTYSCPELGIDDTPVHQSLLRNAIEDIVSNVITGKDFQEQIDAAERSIKYNQSELEQLEYREGKPFEYEDELNKAQKQYIEYSELMRKEMEEKEAKYAQMDSDIKEADNISNTEEDEEDAVRFRMMNDLNPDTSVENVKYEINKLAASLGVDIRIIEDIDDIVDDNKQTQKMMRNAYGWFNPNTQEVVIVLPNATSVDNAKATVLHEVVGHKGLQALFGDKFSTFLSKVYNGSSVTTRNRIMALMEHEGWSKKVATEEYIAELAEKGFDDRESRNMWQKIKDFFMDMLREAKINIGFAINDNDIRYMLWRTYQMQRSKGVMGEAENIAMQQKMRVGNYANDTKYSVKSDRDAIIEEGNRIRAQVKNRMEELRNRADNIEITFDNFFINTRGTFELTDTPKREPDYTSKRRDGSEISSRYWYGTDEGGAYVIRESDHWSGYLYGSNNPDWHERNMQNQTPIASCRWALHMPDISDYNSGWQAGKIYLKDLSVADKTNESLIEGMEKGEKPIRYSLKREIMPGESLMDFAGRIAREEKIKNQSDNENRLAQLREVDRKIRDLVKELNKAQSTYQRNVRSAVGAQREYDIATVKQLTDLVNMMIENKLLDDLTRGEVKRLMAAVKIGTSREDIMPSVTKILDIVASNQIRMAKDLLHKLTTIKASKVNAAGVKVQGKLDIEGQNTIKTFKEAMAMSLEEVTERMNNLQDKLADPNKIVSDNAAIEYNALNLAKMYIDTIKGSEAEERSLIAEMKDAAEQYKESDRSSEERKAHVQYIKATKNAIRNNKMARVNDYNDLIGKLVELESESMTRAKELKQKEAERIRDIHHNANSDMEGIPADEHIKDPSWMKNWRQNAVIRFLFEPMASWDQMLRYFGRKDVQGEGYLFNRFFRNGVMKAVDNEYQGMKTAMERLDKKVAEVYGKKGMRWSDLYTKERSKSDIDVTMINGRKKETITLTQGNALYIYMVNKMDDGKMKLRKMGITEEQVERIVNELDPKFIILADWVQEELLPDLRSKYNDVYERMFGASMGEIENYFPLKILSNARTQEEDVSKPENNDAMPSTITGSIIKRKRNSTALDIMNTDALSLVIEHIQQMEHWAAFAEYNRDVNTLLSYKHFRNQVQNMKSVEFGSGTELWKQFKKTAQLASETYSPKPAKFDRLAANLMKGIAGSKIAYRVYTALKQVLSYPVFAVEANFTSLLKNTTRPDLAWKWCMENLPQFEKRWRNRQSGDTRLVKTDKDWELWNNKIIKKIIYWGMTPNAFVDAVVVAMGAKSVYDTSYPKYIKMGFNENEADKRAKEDAVISFNETQQSNEGAYVSPMQYDRNLISGAFSLYRNSSMLFQRRYFAALRGIGKKFRSDYKEESIEFMTKQYTRQGLPEQQARKAAERRYSRSWFKDAANVAMFGFMAQFIWNIGAGAAYMLIGDDDDEKKKFILDAARHATLGGLEGLAGGNYLSEGIDAALRGEFKNFNPSLHPGLSDLELIKNHLVSDQVQALNDIINITISAYSGVNPKTITNAALAIWDICDNDVKTAKEVSMFILRILNTPQSQLDKIYIDELKMTAKEARKYTPEELAERYVDYKTKSESALTGWAYTEGTEAEAKKKYRNRFKGQAKDRLMTAGDKDINKQFDEYMEKYYKPIAEKVAQAKAIANGDEYKEEDLLYEIEQENPDAYYIYQILDDSKKELDKLASDWLKSITTQDMNFYELDVADEKMYAVKDVKSILGSNK